jgi:hypothetical protein
MHPEVPRDFPHEFSGSVAGAQPKLLVSQQPDGTYVDTPESLRWERWAICADLCEQLIEYVNKHWTGEGPRDAFADRVALAMDSKKAAWGISVAEADWVKARLRAEVKDGMW